MSIWKSMHNASTVSQKKSLKYMGLFFASPFHHIRDLHMCLGGTTGSNTGLKSVYMCVCTSECLQSDIKHFFMICKNKEQSSGPRHTRFPYSPPQIHWRQSLNICLFRAGGKKGERGKKKWKARQTGRLKRCIFLFLKELKMSGFL